MEHDFFIGLESKYWANSAIIGSVPGHPILGELVKLYSSDLALKMSNLMTVHIFSALLKKHYKIKSNGKTRLGKAALYRRDWFYPQSYLTHKVKMTPNSHTIHYYSGTWGTPGQLKALKTIRNLRFLYLWMLRPLEWVTAKAYRRKVNRVLKKLAKYK